MRQAVPCVHMLLLFQTLALTAGTPTGPDIGQAVVVAENSIGIGNHVTVHSGDLAVQLPLAGSQLQNGTSLAIGSHTMVNGALYADAVSLKSGGTVHGDVAFASAFSNKGTVTGAVSDTLTLPVYPVWPTFYGDSPNQDDVALDKDEVVVLEPGTYGDVRLKKDATLVLSGGTYAFGDIDTDNGAHIICEAPCTLLVAGRLATGNGSYIGPGPEAGPTAADIVLYVAGSNGKKGGIHDAPAATVLGKRSTVYANLYAPNGTVTLVNEIYFTGALLGRDVSVGNHTHLVLESAFRNTPPTPEDDYTAVQAGDTVTFVAADEGTTDSLLTNDDDPDGDGLSVVPQSGVATTYGVVDVYADGTFSYTNLYGGEADGFTYTVVDDGNPSLYTSANVFINILEPDHYVSVEVDGTGTGVVTSSPAGITCGGTCTAAFSPGTVVALTATPDNDSLFSGWSGDADCSDGLVTLSADVHCVATFEQPQVFKVVAVSVAGAGSGTITSQPGGIDCGTDCTNIYPELERIVLNATPDEASLFLGWAGDADCEDGIIDGTADVDCMAVFDLKPPPLPGTTVNVTLSGTGSGSVGSEPAGISCPSRCSFEFGSGVRARLLPSADAGSVFVGWLGDPSCEGQIGGGGTVDCEAVFDAVVTGDQHTLSMRVIGGGTISSNPGGIICPGTCAADYDTGTEVRLFARPDSGYYFIGFSGDADCADGQVTLDVDVSCTAEFGRN